MKLGIDLDGCAYPFLKNFLAYCKEIGIEVPEDFIATQWLFYEDLGLNQDQFLSIIEEGIAAKKMFINSGFMDMPEPGFSNTMIHLRAKGHKVHIVTHRNAKGAAHQTLDWLDTYKIPTDALHFVRDKSDVRVDLMIEDSPGNYFDCVDAGIPCVIFNQPYNEFVPNATRVYDWDDYYRLVLAMDAGTIEWNLTQFVTEELQGA